MLTVWKYPIQPADYFTLDIPADAQILTVQAQHDRPTIWVLLDPEALHSVRRFRLVGTGHPIEHTPGELRYIATFQLNARALVFHIFEILA